MSLLRREAAADPLAVARVAALRAAARRGGWVPPVAARAADSSSQGTPAGAREDGLPLPTGARRRGRPVRHARTGPSGGATGKTSLLADGGDARLIDGPGLDVPSEDPPPHLRLDREHASADAPVARWRDGRLDPGRRGVAVLVVVALVAAALAAVVLLRSRPHEVVAPDVVVAGRPVPGAAGVPSADGAASAAQPATGGRTGRGATSSGPAGTTSTAAEVVVSVGGSVGRPGLLRLPAGSRVDDAVRAAGGALPGTDLLGLNLARRLVDGEQVLVGAPPPPGGTGTGAGGGPGPAETGPLDLNTASVAQLDALPGIGPVLAQKIVDWRAQHGRFGSVDQLREVTGIGESKYGQIKDRVVV